MESVSIKKLTNKNIWLNRHIIKEFKPFPQKQVRKLIKAKEILPTSRALYIILLMPCSFHKRAFNVVWQLHKMHLNTLCEYKTASLFLPRSRGERQCHRKLKPCFIWSWTNKNYLLQSCFEHSMKQRN